MSEGAVIMVVYVIFRFWFTFALRTHRVLGAWMPTNHLVRWLNTDRGIVWGLPIGVVLTALYYLVMTWGGEHLDAGGSGWWWVPTLWGAVNTVKFAHLAIRSPFASVYRIVRRRTQDAVGAHGRRLAE